jgi:hypothetical protein
MSCTRRPAARSMRSARRSAAMATSAFQSTTVGRAPITVESPIGIELARTAGFLCHTIGARLRRRPQSVQAELDPASSEQATTASGQDQRLTKSDSDKGAAIIPIDAQPPGTCGFGRAPVRDDREDFRPSSIGRTRSGLREPPRPRDEFPTGGARHKESQARTVKSMKMGLAIRSVQSLHVVVAGSRPSTIRFNKAALWPTCLKCI